MEGGENWTCVSYDRAGKMMSWPEGSCSRWFSDTETRRHGDAKTESGRTYPLAGATSQVEKLRCAASNKNKGDSLRHIVMDPGVKGHQRIPSKAAGKRRAGEFVLSLRWE